MTGPHVHGFGRLHIIKYQLKNKPQIEHNPYQNCNSFFFPPEMEKLILNSYRIARTQNNQKKS